MSDPHYLKKEYIERLINNPLNEEELLICQRNHLLTNAREHVYSGTPEPGSPYFKTQEGKVILDCTSQAWTLNLGHNNPDISYALSLQSQQATHTWSYFLTPVRVRLANKIAEILPGQLKGGKVSFNNSGGSWALECAIRLAMINNKKGDKFVVFRRGYHGSSLAMMGASQRLPMRFSGFGTDHWLKTIYPYCYRCPWNYKGGLGGERDKSCNLECLEMVRETIELYPIGTPIGCIIEPMQGPGGQIPAPVEFLEGLKKICKDNKINLIYDEAQTGFGRTGKMFATEWFESTYGKDVSPDIMTLTKGAGAGVPMGITVAKPKLRSLTEFEEHSTFSSPSLAMAACLVNLEILEKHKIPENAAKQGEKITKFIKDLSEEISEIGDVRGPGLFIGVEFVKDPETREPYNKLLEKLIHVAWDNNIFFGESMQIMSTSGYFIQNILKIKPPLIINDEDTEKICELFEKSLRETLNSL
ncbi:MAG: aminotransferase class III-fold pyridoxal phosphate-dependent enzyme [Promethearchaeota archaeon]|nr:MAG: aminotransferase class III-fold pyridoxal phosphate-dependent enzyme [Candidatus Lokiarchaeota archaeon]